jgi:hypothetical protein
MTASKQRKQPRDLPITSPTSRAEHPLVGLDRLDVADQSSTRYCWQPSDESGVSGGGARGKYESTPRSVP